MMRFRHQFKYLQVDDEKADALPDERGAHVTGEPGRSGRIISLLVRFPVGDFVWHVLLLNNFAGFNPGSLTSPVSVLPDR
jgi:hypothetical protein